MPTALITGISGQDGSYLAEFLLSKGYAVHGIVRRHSVAESQDHRLAGISDRITLHYGDMTGQSSLYAALEKSQPDEIYNLAAQSHVRISFDVPQYTTQVNALGVMNLLEAVHSVCPKAKFYQASSSEMFGLGVDADAMQRETTPMIPVSPYGCAKLFGYALVRHYRRAFGMFAVNGILFNHTSPRRSRNFVEAKIIRAATNILHGSEEKLVLGNLDPQRDWGYSGDYVRAMWMMMQHSEPDDFVVSTGETYSVRDICEFVFCKLGMDYRDHVVQDQRYMRPEELPYLCGDSSKIRLKLGWKNELSTHQVLAKMIAEEMKW